jgi:hypothetical protein
LRQLRRSGIKTKNLPMKGKTKTKTSQQEAQSRFPLVGLEAVAKINIQRKGDPHIRYGFPRLILG